MKKLISYITLLTILTGTSFAMDIPLEVDIPERIETSSSLTLATNYIWRGVSQSGDRPAVQGSIDLTDETGVYAGIWASSVSGTSLEANYYLGYSADLNELFTYDVGAIVYDYFDQTLDDGFLYQGDATEDINLGVYGSVAYNLNEYGEAGVYYEYDTTDTEMNYASFSYDSPFGVSVAMGTTLVDDDSLKYTHYDLSSDLLTVRGYTISGLITLVTPEEGDDSGHTAISISKDI